MAENSGGYIGNKPSDSSVTIARQAYTTTGITTDFTFRSGYTPGYLDAYLNGVRLIETDDYVATDGTTLSLSTAAQDGDTLELIAYKAFNVSEFTLETELGGNFNVSNNLTVGGNINLEGNLDLQDSDKILLGTGDDLQIYHDGGTSFIEDAGAGNLHLKTNGSEIKIDGASTSVARFFNGGSVELHYNGSKKFETTSIGIDVTGHTETDTLNVSGISTFNDHVNLGDNDEIRFGDDNDAKIQVDGSENFIIQGDGTTYLRGSTVIVGVNGGSGSFETAIRVNEIGSDDANQVELYYDNDLKLETIGTGVTVTGSLGISSDIVATGVVTATRFYGDGSQLSGVLAASEAGIAIQDDQSSVGVSTTIDFGSGLSVSPVSAGVVTVTSGASAGISPVIAGMIF